MKRIGLVLLILFILSTLESWAQQPAKGELIPQPPFVASVPETGKWTIQVRRTAENGVEVAPAQGQLQQISTVKSGSLRRDLLTFGNGRSDEYWIAENRFLMRRSTAMDIAVTDLNGMTGNDDEIGDPLQSSGFQGVGWIKADYFDKTMPLLGKVCHHYVYKIRTKPHNPEAVTEIEAWIDAKTKYPVGFRMNGTLYLFQIEASVEPLLTLPEPCGQALQKYRKVLEQRDQLKKDLGL